jgi:hypothetical protein
MKSKKRAKSANRVCTDDVRNMGGKELVLNKMVNHYKALSNIKSVLDTNKPHEHVNKNKKYDVKSSKKETYSF